MGIFGSSTILEVNVRPEGHSTLHFQVRIPGSEEYDKFIVGTTPEIVDAVAKAAMDNGRKSFYGSETSYAVADVKA